VTFSVQDTRHRQMAQGVKRPKHGRLGVKPMFQPAFVYFQAQAVPQALGRWHQPLSQQL
jgi:hypothetical protein